MIDWYYLILLSALFYAITILLEKRMLRKEHAMAFSAASTIVVAALSISLLPFASINVNVSEFGWIVIWSLVSTAGYLLNARLYRHGDVSIGSPVTGSLSILLTVILGYLALGELLTPIQYLCIVLLVVASYLILSQAKDTVRPRVYISKYTHFVLLSAVMNAVGYVITKFVVGNVNVFTFLILTQILMAIELLALMQWKYGGVKEAFKEITSYKYWMLLFGVFSVVYRVAFYSGLVVGPVSIAGPLRNSVSLVIVVVLGCLLFKEKSLFRKSLLALIILIASYLLIVP